MRNAKSGFFYLFTSGFRHEMDKILLVLCMEACEKTRRTNNVKFNNLYILRELLMFIVIFFVRYTNCNLWNSMV